MEKEKLAQLLRTVDPAKRAFLKRVVLGASFAVPIIASYSVRDLAFGGPGPTTCDSTVVLTETTVTTTTTTITTTVL